MSEQPCIPRLLPSNSLILCSPKIKYPYPPTSYCSTPPESDKTNKALCRPLPVADFPKPASTPLPPGKI